MNTPEEIKESTINFTMWHTGDDRKKVTNAYNKYLQGLERDE